MDMVETTRIADETERTRTVVANQRSYVVPADVAERIGELERELVVVRGANQSLRDGLNCATSAAEKLEDRAEQAESSAAEAVNIGLAFIGSTYPDHPVTDPYVRETEAKLRAPLEPPKP